MTFSQTLNARQRPETLLLKNGAGTTAYSADVGALFRRKPVHDSA